jgi:hypothetical protein
MVLEEGKEKGSGGECGGAGGYRMRWIHVGGSPSQKPIYKCL